MIDKDLLMELSDLLEDCGDAIRRYYDGEDTFSKEDLLDMLSKTDLQICVVFQEADINE